MKSDFSDDSGFDDFSEKSLERIPTQRPAVPHLEEEEEVLPRPCPLADSGHSLEPDMLFGWRPKELDLGGPVLLNFALDDLPVKNAIFYGFRPEDSYVLHEFMSKVGEYKFNINPQLKHSYVLVRKTHPRKKRPFLGMSSEPSDLHFSSQFESGNLDAVQKVKEDEFDLYMRTDSNTRGHNQWFYFTVRNLAGPKEVRFNIVNFSKRESLYLQGFRPYAATSRWTGWRQAGEQVRYTYSKLKRDFYSLSFVYTFLPGEEVSFAQSIPYTYTDLMRFLSTLESPYMERSALCQTLSGIEVPLLTVTEAVSSPKRRELIVVTARVHPGEAHSSWVVEGFIQFLLSEHPKARALRKQFVFKIVPMLNPDGVIAGNSRCNLVGDDLNRQFQFPDDRLHPTIFNMKELMKQLVKEFKLLGYFDLHTHSKKKGSFLYAPYYPLHSEKYYKIRIIPKLFSERTEVFRFHSSKYRYEWAKRNTARLVIWRDFQTPFSYTLETSCHGYIDSNRQTISFNAKKLQKLGESFAFTLCEYVELRDEEAKVKEERRIYRLNKNRKTVKKPEKRTRRTLADVIQAIKKDEEEEERVSDSGGSDSDTEENSEQAEEREAIRRSIVSYWKEIQSFASPLEVKDDKQHAEDIIKVSNDLVEMLQNKNTVRVRRNSCNQPPRPAASSAHKRRPMSRGTKLKTIEISDDPQHNSFSRRPVTQILQIRKYNLASPKEMVSRDNIPKSTDSKGKDREMNLLTKLKAMRQISQPPKKKKFNFAIKGNKLKSHFPFCISNTSNVII